MNNTESVVIDLQGILPGVYFLQVSLDNEKGPYIKGAIGQTVFDFKGINGGTHTVYIIDDHNCSSIAVENMPLAIVLDPIVTVTEVVPEQPFPSVAVIVYVEFVAGLAVTIAPVVADNPAVGAHV